MRILALGDSFTFGWGVSERDSFIGRLQAKADAAFGVGKIQILNGSTGGWGTAQELAYLESFGPEIAPKAVIVFANFDDLPRSVRTPLYRLSGAGLALDRVDVSDETQAASGAVRRMIPGYDWLIEHSALAQLVRQVAIRLLAQEAPSLKAPRVDVKAVGAARPSAAATPSAGSVHGPDRLQHALFARMKSWCLHHGAALWVVSIGWLDTGDRSLSQVMRVEDIPFLDLTPTVAPAVHDNSVRFVIPVDKHPTEAGHVLIATAIWPWLEERLVTLQKSSDAIGSASAIDRARLP
jgi:lysophospholipase L1-like esterase